MHSASRKPSIGDHEGSASTMIERSGESSLAVLVFRLALASYLALTLFVALRLFLGKSDALPHAALSYMVWLAQQPNSALASVAGLVALIAVAVSIVSGAAMAVFAGWGRPVFAAAMAGLLSSEAMIELPVLKTPSEYLADTVLAMLAGGIIAMSYCATLSARFRVQV